MLVAASLVLVATVGIVATAALRGNTSATGCEHRRTLSVVAAAELVPAIESVSGSLRCVHVEVAAGDASTVARQVAEGAAPADVWIPDSSRWVAGPPATSVAQTPVVLAAPAGKLRDLGVPATFEGLASAASPGSPLRFTAHEPSRSAPTQAVLIELVDALGTTPALRGHLGRLVRGMGSERVGDTAGRDVSVTASTEREVWAVNAEAGTARLRAIYPPSSGLSMDYPVVVTATKDAARSDAHTLTEALTSPTGVAVIEGLGFRSPSGRASALLRSAAGVDPANSTDVVPLTRHRAASALRTLTTLQRPTRVLALVDVSGSMAQSVPGSGPVSRIELAREALRGGLALFPAGTVAGLWRFSSDLTPSTNYDQVMPLTPLTPRSRGDFTAAIDGLSAVPGGGTGLYDSVLDAVRYVRAGYDDRRVNSVVVLSDGRNEYASVHGITKDRLLAALGKDATASGRAVPVISIAYGPDSDVHALRSISNATGGAVYTARNPRDLPVIFREAIGHRVCDGAC